MVVLMTRTFTPSLLRARVSPALRLGRPDDGAGRSRTLKWSNIAVERFSFTPSEFRVKAGAPVEIRLRSDDTDHGFRIVGTDINITIPKRGKGVATVTFEPPSAGKLHLRVFEAVRGRPRVHARDHLSRNEVSEDDQRRVLLPMAIAVCATALSLAQTRLATPGSPLPGITPAEFEEFRLGLDDFLEVEAAEEGLGPAFNATSCAVCHNVPAIGGAGTIAEMRAGRRNARGRIRDTGCLRRNAVSSLLRPRSCVPGHRACRRHRVRAPRADFALWRGARRGHPR